MPSVFTRIPLQKETLMIEIQQKLEKLQKLKDEKQKTVDELEYMKDRNSEMKQWSEMFSEELASLKLLKTEKETKVTQLEKELQEEKEKTNESEIQSAFYKDEKENLELLIEDKEEKIEEVEEKCLQLKFTGMAVDMMWEHLEKKMEN